MTQFVHPAGGGNRRRTCRSGARQPACAQPPPHSGLCGIFAATTGPDIGNLLRLSAPKTVSFPTTLPSPARASQPTRSGLQSRAVQQKHVAVAADVKQPVALVAANTESHTPLRERDCVSWSGTGFCWSRWRNRCRPGACRVICSVVPVLPDSLVVNTDKFLYFVGTLRLSSMISFVLSMFSAV